MEEEEGEAAVGRRRNKIVNLVSVPSFEPIGELAEFYQIVCQMQSYRLCLFFCFFSPAVRG